MMVILLTFRKSKIDGHFADFGQVKMFSKTPLGNWMPRQSLLFTYWLPRHLDSAFKKKWQLLLASAFGKV